MKEIIKEEKQVARNFRCSDCKIIFKSDEYYKDKHLLTYRDHCPRCNDDGSVTEDISFTE